MGNGPDNATGKKAKGSMRLLGREFIPERRSVHVSPPSVTSRVVPRTRATLPGSMDAPDEGGK